MQLSRDMMVQVIIIYHINHFDQNYTAVRFIETSTVYVSVGMRSEAKRREIGGRESRNKLNAILDWRYLFEIET